MHIEKIFLRNFRNIKRADIDSFSDGINILFGSNGSGKTNLLEAIGLSSIAKSCRGASEQDMVNFDSDSARVDVYGTVQKKKLT